MTAKEFLKNYKNHVHYADQAYSEYFIIEVKKSLKKK